MEPGYGRRAGYLSSMHLAFPADSQDNDGGRPRSRTSHGWNGSRPGNPSAARLRYRRGVVSALHACRLYLDGLAGWRGGEAAWNLRSRRQARRSEALHGTVAARAHWTSLLS